MSTLFTVTVEFVYVIVAEDMERAERVAHKTAREAFKDQTTDDMHWMITEGMYADGWDERCYPYGDPFEKTVGDYLEEQA
jgi:hypothetical protein